MLDVTARSALHYATNALTREGCKVIRVQPRVLEAPDGSRFVLAINILPDAKEPTEKESR